MPVRITADVTASDLTNLASEINQVSDQQKFQHIYPEDKTRIILKSDFGEDIVFSNLSETSPTFSARIVDEERCCFNHTDCDSYDCGFIWQP